MPLTTLERRSSSSRSVLYPFLFFASLLIEKLPELVPIYFLSANDTEITRARALDIWHNEAYGRCFIKKKKHTHSGVDAMLTPFYCWYKMIKREQNNKLPRYLLLRAILNLGNAPRHFDPVDA